MGWELKGKKALVTGGARRIGKEIALGLAAEGVDIALHYSRSEKEVFEAKEEVEARGVACHLLKADFNGGEYEGLVEKAATAAGGLDIVVNNASIFPASTLEDATFDGFVSNARVNAWAPFVLARDLKRVMKKGKVVNLIDSRTLGFDWGHFEYILSKHLLAELTRMTAVRFAPDVIVNGVNPGLILAPAGKTDEYMSALEPTVPQKKRGGPADIVEAVIYLLKSDFLVGEVINVDGGRHLREYDRGPHTDRGA